jgi:NADH-quinone oxidoreductase subunit M
VHSAPALSVVFMMFLLASVGLPLTGNFVGEFLALYGIVQANLLLGVLACTTVVLSACYMLWLYQRIFFGEEPPELAKEIYDMDAREWSATVPMLVVVFWMGIYTSLFLKPISVTNAAILEQMNANRQMQVEQIEKQTPSEEVASAR